MKLLKAFVSIIQYIFLQFFFQFGVVGASMSSAKYQFPEITSRDFASLARLSLRNVSRIQM